MISGLQALSRSFQALNEELDSFQKSVNVRAAPVPVVRPYGPAAAESARRERERHPLEDLEERVRLSEAALERLQSGPDLVGNFKTELSSINDSLGKDLAVLKDQFHAGNLAGQESIDPVWQDCRRLVEEYGMNVCRLNRGDCRISNAIDIAWAQLRDPRRMVGNVESVFALMNAELRRCLDPELADIDLDLE
jgi:hypothetical protein